MSARVTYYDAKAKTAVDAFKTAVLAKLPAAQEAKTITLEVAKAEGANMYRYQCPFVNEPFVHIGHKATFEWTAARHIRAMWLSKQTGVALSKIFRPHNTDPEEYWAWMDSTNAPSVVFEYHTEKVAAVFVV